MRLTVAWWVCTGGERPTPRGPRHSEVVNGVLLCVPLLVCWAGSRMPLLPLVGEGFRCVACCLQTVASRPSEGDNLVRGSPSFDLPPLCIASVWSSFVGSSLCKPHAASVPACLWCLWQVAAVESVKTGKGLTGPELAMWNSVKSSPWLTSKTVGSFLGLPGREARRDLLHEASRLADGTYAVLPVGAQLLADALVTLLSPGVLSLWERGLGRVSSGSGS